MILEQLETNIQNICDSNCFLIATEINITWIIILNAKPKTDAFRKNSCDFEVNKDLLSRYLKHNTYLICITTQI